MEEVKVDETVRDPLGVLDVDLRTVQAGYTAGSCDT
jgi:hypothetical protein